jgi:hypothetical protein
MDSLSDNFAMICRKLHRRLIAEFIKLDATACRNAVVNQDLSSLADKISLQLREHLELCPDCPNDILWLMEIRDEIDVLSFPCIHLAYGSSNCVGSIIEREHGLFAIATKLPDPQAIVIGYCPWCGIELNVSAFSSPNELE